MLVPVASAQQLQKFFKGTRKASLFFCEKRRFSHAFIGTAQSFSKAGRSSLDPVEQRKFFQMMSFAFCTHLSGRCKFFQMNAAACATQRRPQIFSKIDHQCKGNFVRVNANAAFVRAKEKRRKSLFAFALRNKTNFFKSRPFFSRLHLPPQVFSKERRFSQRGARAAKNLKKSLTKIHKMFTIEVKQTKVFRRGPLSFFTS